MPVKYTVWLCLIFILSTAAIVLCARQYLHDTASEFYAHELADAHVDGGVIIDGGYYDTAYLVKTALSGGKSRDTFEALRIAYARALAERNPRFSLAGSDPDTLTTSLHQLESTRNTLATQEESASDARAVRVLYPLQFLNAAAELEKQRRAFVISGSASDAHLYLTLLRNTANEYIRNVRMFEYGFKRTVPKDIRDFAGSNERVSRKGTVQIIDALENRALRAKKDVELRARCIRGFVHYCSVGDLALPIVEEARERETVDIGLLDEIRALVTAAGRDTSAVSQYIQLYDSACLELPQHAVYALRNPVTDTLQRPIWIGDVRFTESDGLQHVDFFRYFISRDAKYIVNYPYFHYKCPSMGRDFSRIYFVKHVVDRIRELRLSDNATDGGTADSLRALEHSLLAGQIAQESDALSYVRYGLLMTADGSLPAHAAHVVRSLALEAHDKSSGLEHTISDIVVTEKENALAMTRGVPVDLQGDTLFYFRSAFLSLFLAYNQSVSDETRTLFPPYHAPASHTPYVYYSDLRGIPGVRSTLIHDMSIYFDTYGWATEERGAAGS